MHMGLYFLLWDQQGIKCLRQVDNYYLIWKKLPFIKKRRLGYTYIICFFIVFTYILIYVTRNLFKSNKNIVFFKIFILEKLYLDKEKCYGDTIARIIGFVYYKSKIKIVQKREIPFKNQGQNTCLGRILKCFKPCWTQFSFLLFLDIVTSHGNLFKVFIPTLIKITKNQKKGDCPSYSLPCLNNTDCKPNELPIYMEKDLCQNISSTQKVIFKFFSSFFN